MTRTMLLLLALAVGSQPLLAQEQAEPEAVPDSVSILRALQLPDVAEILRQRGVPTEEVEAAMQNAQDQDVAPGEMAGAMAETAESVDENGPIENFGAFVQEQLANGLRGRALAEAIRAEHAQRGIGPGNRLEGRGPPEGRGPGMRGGRGGPPDSVRGGPPGARGGPPDSVRGGPPDSVRGGPPDSVRGGPPDSVRGGPPGGRGGPPDSVRGGRPDSSEGGGGDSGSDGHQNSGGQR